MTEQEWLACDDSPPMLRHLGKKASGRKLRLFAVACCRGILHHLKDASTIPTTPIGDSSMAGSTWYFYPPERQKGRVFYDFFNAKDKDYPDASPVLAVLLETLQGTLLAIVPSPYNTPYEVSVHGIKVSLIEDNWPCSYLSASETDAPVFEQVVNLIKRELNAREIDLTS